MPFKVNLYGTSTYVRDRNHTHRQLYTPISINVKKVFYVFIIFIKNAFFIFWNVFLFSNGEIFSPTKPAKILLNLLNSCRKRLLSERFNMAPIRNSLMKNRYHETLSWLLRQ